MLSPRRYSPLAVVLLTIVDRLALQLDEFLAWLNHKGVRELALKNSFIKWWNHIAPGMRKHFSVSNRNLDNCRCLITKSRISTQVQSFLKRDAAPKLNLLVTMSLESPT